MLDLRDLADNTETSIYDKILGAIFKQGGDTYEILLSGKESVEIMRNLLHNGKLSMYEEPGSVTGNSIIVHSPIRKYDESGLEQMVSVIIKHIYVTLEEFIFALEDDQLDSKTINNLMQRDKTLNDHCDVCRRIINITLVNYKSTALYDFVDKCEKIGDMVKNMIEFSYKNQRLMQKHKNLIEGIQEVLMLLYSTVTHFSVKKFNHFYSEVKKTIVSVEKIIVNVDSCDNCRLYHYLAGMLGLIQDSYSDIIVKNL